MIAALITIASLSIAIFGCSNEKPRRIQRKTISEDTAKGSLWDDIDDVETNEPQIPEYTFPTPSDYFTYLNETFQTEQNDPTARLADIADKTITVGKSYNTSLNNANTGVLSALVLDFDNDNELEMLTVSIQNTLLTDTNFKNYLYSHALDQNALTILARSYDIENGEIVECTPVPLATMPTDGWGYFTVGIAKYEDAYILYTGMTSETMETYGPEYMTLYKVSSDERLSVDFISAITNYGLSEIKAQELWSVHDVTIRPSDTTIEDMVRSLGTAELQQSYGSMDLNAFVDVAGDFLVCVYALDPISYGGDIINKILDNTHLRHYLETNGEDYQAPDIPVAFKKDTADGTTISMYTDSFGNSFKVENGNPNNTSSAFDNFVQRIESTVGTELLITASEVNENILARTYTTRDNMIVLYWDTKTDELVSISIRTHVPTPEEEWYVLKEFVLTDELFEWEAGETDFLRAKDNWMDYLNGVQVGKYTVSIGQVADSWISIVKTENEE